MISVLPLCSILRETASGYKLSKEEGKINHLMLTDDLKLYRKNVKEIYSLVQTVRVFSRDSRDFGIEKCAVMIVKRKASMVSWDKITWWKNDSKYRRRRRCL